MKDETATWNVDLGHSSVNFRVRHLAIGQVTGIFSTFKGQIKSDNDGFEGAKINFEISADSINTNNAQRDEHLKSDIFFDTKQFPEIAFIGNLEKQEEKYLLNGQLSVHGVTKDILMDAEFLGTDKGRFGEKRAAFEVKGNINRKDFGLTWNMLSEAGGLLIGEEIKLHIYIQVIADNPL